MPNMDELQTAYPHIPRAMFFVEFIMDKILMEMREMNLPVEKAVLGAKMLAETPPPVDRTGEIDRLRKAALAEMEHPSFITYMAGKLGAV